MQDVIASMMRFTTAVTLFGMQQVQNAVVFASDSQTAMNKFKDALDSLTDVVTKQFDSAKTATLESMLKAQKEMVDRGMSAMNVQALDPREMMQTTTDLMRKTTESFADMVKKATADPRPNGNAEPKSVADLTAPKA